MNRRPKILLVDDDLSFLDSISDALADDGLEVYRAENGSEALERLGSEEVDLVITDINMPTLDGIGLIKGLINRKGIIPCLVMSAFFTPDLEKRLRRLGALHIIHKPIDLPTFRSAVQEALLQKQEGGVLRGVTLASFLQLLALERMTCTVKVSSGILSALVFFENGVLLDATTGTTSGIEACFEILCWPAPEIAVHSGCGTRVREIPIGLEAVLLEAMRLADEHQSNQDQPGPTAWNHEERETTMALEKHLDEFKSIKGYLASGVLNFTGETLATHSVSDRVNLESFGAVFNDVFRGAHEASAKIGLDSTRVMTLQTPKGIVLMECSGPTNKAHLHIMVVLDETGNQALTRMTLEKVVPKVVQEVA
jgi:CheY-like chemotaxis protein/predicted regulator of Ras-like GTPase activity (Roadblock/LC7/MglB family)